MEHGSVLYRERLTLAERMLRNPPLGLRVGPRDVRLKVVLADV